MGFLKPQRKELSPVLGTKGDLGLAYKKISITGFEKYVILELE